MTIADSVAAIVRTYRQNPAAMAKAVEALVTSILEKRTTRSEAEAAAVTCRRLHPQPSSRVVCAGCFDAAIAKINSVPEDDDEGVDA